MDRFQSSIEVDAPANICYQKWHRFEEFPHFMNNVQQVRQVEGNRWHWVVKGPIGNYVEWDAVIDGDEANRVISWHSVQDSEVAVQGAVRFDEIAHNKTQVTCTIQYEPPAKALGEIVAHIFSNPEKMVQEDLTNFKHLVEGTNVPVEKAHASKVMQPDSFVVPEAQTGQTNYASGSATRVDYAQPNLSPQTTSAAAADYAASEVVIGDSIDQEDIYDLELEDSTPPVGTSAEIDREDVTELESLHDEEEPYLGLGPNGALYSEDLIDMRSDQIQVEETDIFTNSMDVDQEDLESFIEDMDEEVDAAFLSEDITEQYDINDSGALVNQSRTTQDKQL